MAGRLRPVIEINSVMCEFCERKGKNWIGRWVDVDLGVKGPGEV